MTSPDVAEQIRIQREYYAQTAQSYDAMRSEEEAAFALATGFLCGVAPTLGVTSILDVGAGTGATTMKLRDRLPGVRVVGLEPVQELREVGHRRGLGPEELIEGDATRLAYPDGAFDLVCEFGALHHIPDPAQAVREMVRVARKAVFICDVNNFGQGGVVARRVKQLANTLGLWPLLDYIKTRGRGYSICEGDGLFYSYSVFNNLRELRAGCSSLHFMNSNDAGPDLYRTAPGAIVLGIKRPAG
ncbi:MAG TPA: class I SAM-dependent methyltransferase [Gammaproteobacteria bacterium]|nr:class I SAM-dependent methyltransferase [Gammaproteobacteria bacterium]